MNYKYIIVLTILVLIIIISVIFNIIQYFSNNNKLLGAYKYKDLNIKNVGFENQKSMKIDKHFKDVLLNFCNENKFKCNDSLILKYENNSYLNSIVDDVLILKYPESFIPDFTLSNKKIVIFIECDEGNNFHSDNNNINYVKKWINYNEILIENNIDGREVIVIRFTYPDSYKVNKNDKFINEELYGIFDEFLTYILNIILIGSYIPTGCYILYKLSKNYYQNTDIKIVPQEKINTNPTKSAEELYNNFSYIFTTIFHEENVKACKINNEIRNWKNDVKNGNIIIPYNLRTLIISLLQNIYRSSFNIYNIYWYHFNEEYISKYKIFYETFIENWYKRYGFDKIKTSRFSCEGHQARKKYFMNSQKNDILNKKIINFQNDFEEFITQFNLLNNIEEQKIYINLIVFELICIYEGYLGNYNQNIFNDEIKQFIKSNINLLTPELKYRFNNLKVIPKFGSIEEFIINNLTIIDEEW